MNAIYSTTTIEFATIKNQNKNNFNEKQERNFLESFISKRDTSSLIKALPDISLDLNAWGLDGDLLLHQAIRADLPEVVRALLDKGANPAIRDSKGLNALELAGSLNNNKLIIIILANKWGKPEIEIDNLFNQELANIRNHGIASYQNNFSHGLIKARLYFYSISLVVNQIKKDSPNYTELFEKVLKKFDCPPICYAIYTGQIQTVRDLLKTIPVNFHNEQGDSLLHVAATFHSKEILSLLIESGIEVNHQNHNGETALHYAAALGNLSHMEILMKQGKADLALQDSNGFSPLFYFAISRTKPEKQPKYSIPKQKTSKYSIWDHPVTKLITVVALFALFVSVDKALSDRPKNNAWEDWFSSKHEPKNNKWEERSYNSWGSWSSYGEHSYKPSTNRVKTCSGLTLKDIKPLSDIERVRSEDLNPKCPQDAAWILSPANNLEKMPTLKKIKAQFRKLALKFHPDKFKDEKAEETFHKISDASDCVTAYLEGKVRPRALCP